MPPKTPVQMPGATALQAGQPDTDTAAVDPTQDTGEGMLPDSGTMDPADEIAALRAQLRAKDAEIAKRDDALAAASARPTTVVVPVTPHGRQRLSESEYAGMTTATLMRKIDAGEVAEPFQNVLCADGYYCKRG